MRTFLTILRLIAKIIWNDITYFSSVFKEKSGPILSDFKWGIHSSLVRGVLRFLVTKERLSIWQKEFSKQQKKKNEMRKEAIKEHSFNFGHSIRRGLYYAFIHIAARHEKIEYPQLYRGEEVVEEPIIDTPVEPKVTRDTITNLDEYIKSHWAEEPLETEEEAVIETDVIEPLEAVEEAESIAEENAAPIEETETVSTEETTALEPLEVPEPTETTETEIVDEATPETTGTEETDTTEEPIVETASEEPEISVEPESEEIELAEEVPETTIQEPETDEEKTESPTKELQAQKVAKSAKKTFFKKASNKKVNLPKVIISWLFCLAVCVGSFVVAESFILGTDLDKAFLPIQGTRTQAQGLIMLGLFVGVILFAETTAAIFRLIKRHTIRRSTVFSESTKVCILTYFVSTCFIVKDYLSELEYVPNLPIINKVLVGLAAVFLLLASIKLIIIVDRYTEE